MLDRSRPLRWKSCLQISSEECVWVKSIPKSRCFKLVQHVLIHFNTAMICHNGIQCKFCCYIAVTHGAIPTWQPGHGRSTTGSRGSLLLKSENKWLISSIKLLQGTPCRVARGRKSVNLFASVEQCTAVLDTPLCTDCESWHRIFIECRAHSSDIIPSQIPNLTS